MCIIYFCKELTNSEDSLNDDKIRFFQDHTTACRTSIPVMEAFFICKSKFL